MEALAAACLGLGAFTGWLGTPGIFAAVGALLTSLVLARHPMRRHVGVKMFGAVALLWSRLFPALRDVQSLSKPEEDRR